MVDLIVLKEQWEEFKQLYAQDMYKDKVLHMTEEADKDNVRVARLLYSMANVNIHKDNVYIYIQDKKNISLEEIFKLTRKSDIYVV